MQQKTMARPSTRSHFRSHHLQLVLLHKGYMDKSKSLRDKMHHSTSSTPLELPIIPYSYSGLWLVRWFVYFFSSEEYFPVIFLPLPQGCHEHRHLALRSYVAMFTFQLTSWELVQVNPSAAGLGFVWKME